MKDTTKLNMDSIQSKKPNKADNIVTKKLNDHLQDQMEFHEERQEEQTEGVQNRPTNLSSG